MSSRHDLIQKAASFPAGHPERKAILARLKEGAGITYTVNEARIHGNNPGLRMTVPVEVFYEKHRRGQHIASRPSHAEVVADVQRRWPELNKILAAYGTQTIFPEPQVSLGRGFNSPMIPRDGRGELHVEIRFRKTPDVSDFEKAVTRLF